jgi:hypothetical protein
MTKLILTAFAAVALSTIVSSAEAKLATNGANLNGVALNGVQVDGIQVRQPSVKAVILPTGEILELRSAISLRGDEMTKLFFAALTVAALSAAASTAYAGGTGYTSTIGWGCHTCGTQLTGIAVDRLSIETINAVILPSGEVAE